MLEVSGNVTPTNAPPNSIICVSFDEHLDSRGMISPAGTFERSRVSKNPLEWRGGEGDLLVPPWVAVIATIRT